MTSSDLPAAPPAAPPAALPDLSPRRSLAYAAALGGTVTAVSVAAKVHKALRLDPDAGWLAWLGAGLGDLCLGAAWCAVVLVALHVARWRRSALALAHAGTLVLLVYALVEHAFFLSTGSLLDYAMLAYTARHFAMVRSVIASEIRGPTVAALASVAVLAVWPVALRPLRQVWSAPLPGDRRWTRAGLGGAVLLLGLGLWLDGVGLPDSLQPLRRGAVAELATGAWRAARGQQGPVQASAEALAALPPVQPLVVTRTSATRPLNVVLIVLESTRAQSTTPYQPALDTTPVLARLAAAGTRVERMYTTVPHTTKALVPIHCGIHPRPSQGFGEATHGALPSDCLARILAHQGYATAYMQPCDSVFERRRDLVRNFGFETMLAKEDLPAAGFEEIGYFGYEDRVLTQPALAWIDAQKDPFFLAITTVASHHDYDVPSTWPVRKYTADATVNAYLNTLRYTDAFVGELLAGLEQRKLMDDTVIVLIGDHGEAFGEHGIFQHDNSVYEETLRVPFVLHGAGVPKGKVLPGPYQNIDVLPTVLELLGLDLLAGELPGRSVLSAPPHERLFAACWNPDRCMATIEGDRKTIDHGGTKAPEVFDLAKDPGEKHNLLAKGAPVPAAVQASLDAAQGWRQEVLARFARQAQRRQTPYVSTTRPKVRHPADIVFGGVVRLLGYDIDRARLQAGEPTWITWYFEVLQQPPPGWKLFVHLHGPSPAFQRLDHVPVEGAHPVADWRPGQFVTDRHWVRPSPHSVTGTFEVTLGFFDDQAGNRRIAPDGTGLQLTLDNSVLATRLEVTNPKKPKPLRPVGRAALPEALQALVEHPAPTGPGRLDVAIGDCVRLVDVTLPATPVRAGSQVEVRSVYRATCAVPRYTQLFMHLLGEGGRYRNLTHGTVEGKYLPSDWRPGDQVTDVYRFTVPPDWPAGPARLGLGLWNPNLRTPLQRLPVGAGEATDAVSTDEGRTRALVGEIQVVR